jgi:hypothetical protein
MKTENSSSSEEDIVNESQQVHTLDPLLHIYSVTDKCDKDKIYLCERNPVCKCKDTTKCICDSDILYHVIAPYFNPASNNKFCIQLICDDKLKLNQKKNIRVFNMDDYGIETIIFDIVVRPKRKTYIHMKNLRFPIYESISIREKCLSLTFDYMCYKEL